MSQGDCAGLDVLGTVYCMFCRKFHEISGLKKQIIGDSVVYVCETADRAVAYSPSGNGGKLLPIKYNSSGM